VGWLAGREMHLGENIWEQGGGIWKKAFGRKHLENI